MMTPATLSSDLARIVAEAAPDELPVLAGAFEQARAAAWARLTTPAPPVAAGQSADENLDVGEAARRLGMSADYLYRWEACPFRVRIGRRVKFSAHGLEKWNSARRGRS